MSHESATELFPIGRYFRSGDLIAEKYRLVRRVGEGAMGTVWVAHNEVLDVDVALKLIRVDNGRADQSRMYQRLLQEARAAARLGHWGIVRIFDFGQASDGTPFIVMELLEGESLANLLLREGRIEPTRAVQMLLPIADALASAHDRGIVHRDVKPENIFIARDGYGRLQPKIVDFGVARFAEGGRTLTRSGALMGTPDYMAPEQAKGLPDIDHRVDVWALCVVLYELIAGQRPFAQNALNYFAVLRAIVHEEPTSLLELTDADPALWLILERGLRKEREQRWDTLRVLGEALALWLYERGIREDAFGASLKTTWLQSGIGGLKIETQSNRPPPPTSRKKLLPNPSQPAPAGSDIIPSSELVTVGELATMGELSSTRLRLGLDSKPAPTDPLDHETAPSPELLAGLQSAPPDSEPPLAALRGSPFLPLAVAAAALLFALAAVIFSVGRSMPAATIDEPAPKAGQELQRRTLSNTASNLKSQQARDVAPLRKNPSAPPPEDTATEPDATTPSKAPAKASSNSRRPADGPGKAPTKRLPSSRTYDFGF